MEAVGTIAYGKAAALEIEHHMVVKQAVLVHCTMIPNAPEGRVGMPYYWYS